MGWFKHYWIEDNTQFGPKTDVISGICQSSFLCVLRKAVGKEGVIGVGGEGHKPVHPFLYLFNQEKSSTGQ